MEFLIIVAGIILDQVSKWAATAYLNEGSVSVIRGLLSFTLVDNPNGAFGLFGGISGLLLPVSVIIVAVCIWFMLKAKRKNYKLLSTGIALIVSGAFGNIIDRFVRGSVVDFIQVHLFDFPVFNVADIFVVVGAFGSLLLIMFTKAGDVLESNK